MKKTKNSLKLLLFVVGSLVLGTAPVRAQHLNPTPAPAPNLPSENVIEERLVKLALEGPQYNITEHQVKISEAQLAKARLSWLNLLTLSANFNDQTFAQQSNVVNGTAYVYPKYFFGLVIPLGVIFSMGPDIRSAREGLQVSQDAREQMARNIRTEVLSKYRQYRNFGQLIGLQNSVVVDEQSAMTQLEKKFKDGTITFEQYNLANKTYNDDLARKLNLQLQQDLVKLDVEQMIGTHLESVLK
jgi:outer membrane protein TolC